MSNIFRNFEKQRELLKKIPYLKGFSEEHREILAKCGYFEEFDEGEVIIEENGINQKLYFLIKGEVEVLLSGNSIVKLRGGGRLFGEMSFVKQSFTTATVRANSKVVMMFFNTTDFIGMENTSNIKLLLELYKMISEALAIKLQKTTEIAKTFHDQVQNSDID